MLEKDASIVFELLKASPANAVMAVYEAAKGKDSEQ